MIAVLAAACSPTPDSPGAIGSTGVAGTVRGVGTTGTAAPTTTTPRPRVSNTVTAVNPGGLWVIGATGEPGPGPVVACKVNQTLTLTLTGGRLQGSVNTCAGVCERLELLDGTYTDGTATLDGTAMGNFDPNGLPVAYLLKFDAATMTEISQAKSTKPSRIATSPPIRRHASARSLSAASMTWPLPS